MSLTVKSNVFVVFTIVGLYVTQWAASIQYDDGSVFSSAAFCSSAITSAGMRSGVELTRIIMGSSDAPSRAKVTQLQYQLARS